MRSKVWTVFFCIISVVLFLCIATYLLSNTTPLKSGKIYYTDNFTAYCYDIRGKIKNKIAIAGYKNVSFYLPVEDGYIAVVDNIKDDTDDSPCILIYNDEELISKASISDLFFVGNYIFYFSENSDLYAFNYKTKKDCEIMRFNKLGYSHVDNYVYYSDRNGDSFYEEKEIFVIDCTADKIEPIVVDTGIICRNTDNALIYTKGNKYYRYNFQKMKPEEINSDVLKKDKFQKKYLGSISIDDSDFDIHLYKLKIYDPAYKNYTEYLHGATRGDYTSVIDLFRGCIKIGGSNGALYIPTSKSNAVTVEAIEYNNQTYYTHKACTYRIFYYE